MSRFVYVIGPEGGPFKIGVATNPTSRLAAIQCGNPSELRLVCSEEVATNDAIPIEQHAHFLLREKAVRGEWFAVTAEEAADATRMAVNAIRTGDVVRHRQTAQATGRSKPGGLAVLLRRGVLSERHFDAGRKFGWHIDQVNKGYNPRARGEDRIWLQGIAQKVVDELGADALTILKSVVIEGKSSTGPAMGLSSQRGRKLLCLALDVVAAELELGMG